MSDDDVSNISVQEADTRDKQHHDKDNRTDIKWDRGDRDRTRHLGDRDVRDHKKDRHRERDRDRNRDRDRAKSGDAGEGGEKRRRHDDEKKADETKVVHAPHASVANANVASNPTENATSTANGTVNGDSKPESSSITKQDSADSKPERASSDMIRAEKQKRLDAKHEARRDNNSHRDRYDSHRDRHGRDRHDNRRDRSRDRERNDRYHENRSSRTNSFDHRISRGMSRNESYNRNDSYTRNESYRGRPRNSDRDRDRERKRSANNTNNSMNNSTAAAPATAEPESESSEIADFEDMDLEDEEDEEVKAERAAAERKARRAAIEAKFKEGVDSAHAAGESKEPKEDGGESKEEANGDGATKSTPFTLVANSPLPQGTPFAMPSPSSSSDSEEKQDENNGSGQENIQGTESEKRRAEELRVFIRNSRREDEDNLFSENFAADRQETSTTRQDGRAFEGDWNDKDHYYLPKIGEIIQNRYKVLSESLAKGVFGCVFKCEDLEVDAKHEYRVVAVKCIRAVEMMRRGAKKEADNLRKLHKQRPDKHSSHGRHCIALLDMFDYRDHPCMVFEFMPMDMAQAIKKNSKDGRGCSLALVAHWSRQFASGLRHIHKNALVHADIKPQNVLVSNPQASRNFGTLKICDFGTAMERHELITGETYHCSRWYRPPELMLAAKFDAKTDVWSMGATIWEAITGTVMFPGSTVCDMLKLIMEKKGKMSGKVIKSGQNWNKYFDSQLDFIYEDPRTKRQRKILQFPPINFLDEFVNIQKPETREKYKSKDWDENAKVYFSGLKEAADYVDKTTQTDPARRLDSDEACKHPFHAVAANAASSSRHGASSSHQQGSRHHHTRGGDQRADDHHKPSSSTREGDRHRRRDQHRADPNASRSKTHGTSGHRSKTHGSSHGSKPDAARDRTRHR